MKNKTKTILIIFLFVSCCHTNLSAQELDDHLKILEPLLGKAWTGMLMAPDGSPGFNIERKFELAKSGKIVKCSKINIDRNKYGEGYFYWNDIEKKIAYFFIEEDGVFLKGFANTEENKITIEGIMTWPKQMNPNVKQQYEFKNTFEFNEDGSMTDKWFMNAFGPWQPGHTIKFTSN